MEQEDVFKRRILGLTSYFRSTQEALLPNFEPTATGEPYHIVPCEMSAYQFAEYDKIRKAEYESEQNSSKMRGMKQNQPNSTDVFDIPSSYRVFSRVACNFIFPTGIERPRPPRKSGKKEVENGEGEDENNEGDDENENEEVVEKSLPYKERIQLALAKLNSEEYLSPSSLSQYSPKFSKILENVSNPDHRGTHLLYSNFREVEGIEILRMAMMHHGLDEFKLQKNRGEWEIANLSDKPKFVLYTGSENAQERELIRNIYNGSWEQLPSSLKTPLIERYGDQKNLYGDVIKIMMITASGAEGINLKNTRYVHIVEPYWHMIRIEQVVGRARRICSHEDLPKELRTVKVFFYMATFSEEQQNNEKYKELRRRDVSKRDPNRATTTDESLYEIADIKYKINLHLLNAIKGTAIDCQVYAKPGQEFSCYNVGRGANNQFLSLPALEQDAHERPQAKTVNVDLISFQYQKLKYYTNRNRTEIYSVDDVKLAKEMGTPLVSIGEFVNGKVNLR